MFYIYESRLRIKITYCVGSSVRWPDAVALVGYFAFFSLFLFHLIFIHFIFISHRLSLDETRPIVFKGREEERGVAIEARHARRISFALRDSIVCIHEKKNR